MYWGARGWPSSHCTKLLFQIHLSSSAKCLPHQFVPYLAMLCPNAGHDLACPFGEKLFTRSLDDHSNPQWRPRQDSTHSISQDNGISNFDLSSDISLYTLATIHFIILYYVFVLHILLYPFVISCVQILYSQLSLRLPRENSALPLASLSHQSCVKYITDVSVNTC